MKHLIYIICVLLCVSCSNQSNRQTAFDCVFEEELWPVYVIIENEKTSEIQWIMRDIGNLLDDLDPSSNNRDSIIAQLKQNINPTVPYFVSDSVYKKLIKNGSIEFDEEIYNYYKQYGVDSLIQHYDINKYTSSSNYGNADCKKIDYIGFLLWQNDICISTRLDEIEWYYLR